MKSICLLQYYLLKTHSSGLFPLFPAQAPKRVVTKAKDKINILNMSYNCKSNHSPLQAVELKECTNFLQSAFKENWKTILCRKGPIQFSHKLALEHINNKKTC
jgi:hypothetical protein